jgi:ankyrin repeat protein
LEIFIGVRNNKIVEGPNNSVHFLSCAEEKGKESLQKLFIYSYRGDTNKTLNLAKKMSLNELNTVMGGETPLFLAAKSGNYDLVKFFWEKGADINLKCPITAAIAQWNNNVFDYLISKGANINCSTDDKSYPLDIARMNCNKYAIEILEGKSAKEKGDWKTKNGNCNF